MKTADEMFEELGYKKYESKDKIKYILSGNDIIKFDLRFKLVKTEIFNGTSQNLSKSIDIQELQAINKKAEELGWMD